MPSGSGDRNDNSIFHDRMAMRVTVLLLAVPVLLGLFKIVAMILQGG